MISELLDTQSKVYQAFFIVDIKAFPRDTQSWHAFCLLFSVRQNNLAIGWSLAIILFILSQFQITKV